MKMHFQYKPMTSKKIHYFSISPYFCKGIWKLIVGHGKLAVSDWMSM